MTATGPLTFPELDAIPVGRVRGVGERKLSALESIGVRSVLDLIDHRTGARRTTALLVALEPVALHHRVVGGELVAEVHPGDGELFARAEVGLHERRHHVGVAGVIDHP